MVVAVGLVFFGCKADELEIDIEAADAVSVLDGETYSAEFEAVFSSIGDLDDEDRAQVESIRKIVNRYLEISDFELEATDMGFEVSVEGEIPVTSSKDSNEPYFVHVSRSTLFDSYYRAQLKTGNAYTEMKNEMEAVNFMLSPEEYHPTQFRLTGESVEVIAPAAQVDGTAYYVFQGTVDRRLTMNFKGGVFDNIGAGFFFRMPE